MAHSKARAFEVQCNVFLSFCGVDTRYDFMGFLHKALREAGIKVFRDENEIKEGDEIDEKILQAIDKSKIYIPIISQTYPNRKWCLIELERMMNNVSQSEGRKKIFPIFYKVEPGDVKHRTPHLENPPSEVKLTAFKEALAKVGRIKGWKVEERRSQEKIVNLVVQKVLEELGRKPRSQSRYPIALDDSTHLSNRAIKRCTGRGSPSRGNIERGRSPRRTTTEIARMQDLRMEGGSIGRGEIRGILSITSVEGLRMESS